MNAPTPSPGRPMALGMKPDTPPTQEPRQFLSFVLGGEVYAVGILAVKEIIEHHGLTQVPLARGSVRGVINLRGAVVPVMDLATRLGLPSSPLSKRSCIVIVEQVLDGQTQITGLVVDAVNAVQDILPSDIEPAPSFGMKIPPDFIAGMGKIGSRFVVLLDIDEVLAVVLPPHPVETGGSEAQGRLERLAAP